MNIVSKKIVIIVFCIGLMGCLNNNQSYNYNYIHCNQTSNGRMAEIEEGYFFAYDKMLYYADKDNMELWVPVCNKPDCAHKDKNCNAYLPTHNIITHKDEKLYGLEYMDISPYIYEIATDGSGLKKVYDIPVDVNSDGYSTALFQDMFLLNYSYLDEYGRYQEHVISLENDKEHDNVVISNLYGGEEDVILISGNIYWSIRGDNLIATNLYAEDISKGFGNLCKIDEGTIIPLDLPDDISLYGGYMNGDIFTYYQPKEGFYKYNITTNEKELIFQNQLKDGQGYILDNDWLVEYNRYMDYMPNKAYLKIYNGQKWKDVELPKEIAKTDDPFYPVCIASDKMFFRRSHTWSDGSTTVYLYYIMFNEKNPKLVKAGVIGEEKQEANLEVDTSVYANFEEVVVFDTEEYLFKVTDVYLDKANNFCIDFYSENISDDTNYDIRMPHCVINGIQCITDWGSEMGTTFCFDNNRIGTNKFSEFYNATEYTDIEMEFYLLKDNKFLEKKNIHIYPQGKEKTTYFSREPQDTDNVLVDNENVSVVVIGYENTLISNDTINVLIKNKTDTLMLVSVNECYANGILVESEAEIHYEYRLYISPGATGMYPMSLFDGALEGPYPTSPNGSFFNKNNITSIEEIKMRLLIQEDLYAAGGKGEVFLDKIFVLTP